MVLINCPDVNAWSATLPTLRYYEPKIRLRDKLREKPRVPSHVLYHFSTKNADPAIKSRVKSHKKLRFPRFGKKRRTRRFFGVCNLFLEVTQKQRVCLRKSPKILPRGLQGLSFFVLKWITTWHGTRGFSRNLVSPRAKPRKLWIFWFPRTNPWS